MILIVLDLLSCVLQTSIWSVLVNEPCSLENNVCSSVAGYNVCKCDCIKVVDSVYIFRVLHDFVVVRFCQLLKECCQNLLR